MSQQHRGFFHRLNLPALILVFLVLLSAFAVIFSKELNRRLFIQYQEAQHHQHALRIEWGQLLLEQSTWSTQDRVQRIAQERLGMKVPVPHDIVMIKS